MEWTRSLVPTRDFLGQPTRGGPNSTSRVCARDQRDRRRNVLYFEIQEGQRKGRDPRSQCTIFWTGPPGVAKIQPHTFGPETSGMEGGMYYILRYKRDNETGTIPGVEQAVVYSTSTTGLSTLTFRGEVVAGDGGVEKRSEVMYCIEGRTYIYYRVHNGHSCIV